MKKKEVLILFFLLGSVIAKAQSSATQTVTMSAPNTMEVTFTGTAAATGGTVNLAFATINDYANGVTSADQQLSVSANSNFAVAVKASAANFSYTGSTSPAPLMPVSGILSLLVSANSTGGTIASPFSGYTTLSSANQNIINSGTAGSAKLFSIRYKATPGFTYPSGVYTVNVVYTISQM